MILTAYFPDQQTMNMISIQKQLNAQLSVFLFLWITGNVDRTLYFIVNYQSCLYFNVSLAVS